MSIVKTPNGTTAESPRTVEPTDRTRVRRYPARAAYDRAVVDAVLDEGMYCHVGFTVDGQPYVIPTIYVRDGDRILIHGSPMSRMLRMAAAGTPLCVTVTLADGVVLARSAFHHSMNYRSVVVLGQAREVADQEAKLAAMRALVDHLIPGRWAEVRTPTPGEIAGTIILELPIDEVSAKVRTGGPIDSEDDYALNVWAGHIPVRLAPAAPIPDDRLPAGIEVPDYIRFWRRNPTA